MNSTDPYIDGKTVNTEALTAKSVGKETVTKSPIKLSLQKSGDRKITKFDFEKEPKMRNSSEIQQSKDTSKDEDTEIEFVGSTL